MRVGYSAQQRNGLDPDEYNPAPGYPAAGAGRPLASRPTVTIFLCTLNGERFLAEQLASLEWQVFAGWRLVASDDGPTDRPLAILRVFRDSHVPGKVEIIEGPRRGPQANFLFLARRHHPVSKYYAFCGQDDVSEPDRLARAIAILEQAPRGAPALYGSRTRLIDASGKMIGFSPLFPRTPTFRSALVQSIVGRNTMVFNRTARDLLAYCGPDGNVPSHDWWVYQVTSAYKGMARYDPSPSVRYRQLGSNVICSNMGFAAHLRRLLMLAQGRFRHWADLNVVALTRLQPRMSTENRHISICSAGRDTGRVSMFAKAGVYRHTRLGNLGLIAAVVLKKVRKFVETIEQRQGMKVRCPEQIAFRMGFIGRAQLKRLAQPLA